MFQPPTHSRPKLGLALAICLGFCTSIVDALDLLRNPKRLIATLRS